MSASSLQVPHAHAHAHPSADADPYTTSPVPRLALPAFASIGQHDERRRSPSRDDRRAGSSTSGSRRSRSHDGSKERAGRPDRLSKHDSLGSSSGTGFSRKETLDDTPPAPAPERPAPETNAVYTHASRRSSTRSSGGFLLGSIGKGRGSRMTRVLQAKGSADGSQDRKGKSPSKDSTGSVGTDLPQTPVSKLRNSHSQASSSIGSSPLSSEVKPAEVNGNGVFMSNNGTVRARPSSPLAHRSGSLDPPEQKLEIMKRPTTSVGYDTDPAQIVSMALSLSEARRRQASERRYVSAGQHGRQRVVSTASTAGGKTRQQPTGSVAQYLQAQRTPSMRSAGPPTPNISTDERRSSQVGTPEVPIGDENDIMGDFDHEISQPTKARVERARVFFELAYEHRRLLSHLPPVRRPGTDANPNNPDRQTKAYNPLQYIRNRKLRIWDKSTIDGEADGWHDVDKVRAWVDAVIESHTETRHDPAECVRMPPLARDDGSASSRDASHSGSKDRHHHRPEVPTIRRQRPRSDWVTHPGDIVADCFWLEQGMNKLKILDRDNNTIYPPTTQFKFSGWRNQTPVHVPHGLQQPSPPPEPEDQEMEDAHQALNPVSELPTFRSANKRTSGRDKKRRSKIKDSVAAADQGGLAKGIKVFMEDSDSSSSEHSSGSPGAERGRRRLRKRHKQQSEISPGQIPPPPPARPEHTSDPAGASDQSVHSSKQNSKRTSIDHGSSGLGRFLKRESHSKNVTPASRSLTRAEHKRHESLPKFPGLEEKPRSSAEYDSTAPNSPTHPMFPSIAINLESPPHSRSPSPTKRHLSSILKPLHRHHKHDSVQEKDFGEDSKRSSVAAPIEEKPKEESREQSRGTSPMTRGQSPMTKIDPHVPAAPVVHEQHDVSRVSTKSTAPSSDHSKIRGIFKGGRIAEIVGHEVSRVGDFIWKKDPPGPHRRRDSDDSARSGYDSDSEGEPVNGTVVKTPPALVTRSRSSTISSSKSADSPVVSNKSPPGSGGRPKLNNPNLPSFTSPFDRDREEQQRRKDVLTPDSLDPLDHIARQAAEHRSASKSPRLDRLAPPRLNTGDRSTSPNRLDVSDSNLPGLALSLTRSQDASDKLNSALHERGGGGGSPALAAMRSRQSAIDLSRISTHDLDAAQTPNVTWRDIHRARALLLSSAVKAKEIGRRADAPRANKSAERGDDNGHNIESASKDLSSAVTRRQEHVVAASRLTALFTSHAATCDERLQRFTATVAPTLHRRLQGLEDLVENSLTPRVRGMADEAGELSIKLSTTSTLAVKGVNEVVDAAVVRTRRGPVTWLRRGWYAGVEYAVVGLLWGIWAVVSVVRVVMMLVSGVGKGARWVLWMD